MANRFRIARLPSALHTPLYLQDAPVLDSAEAILKALRNGLPADWGSLLAAPRRSGDFIDWWAEGLGNAVALSSLPPHEQDRLRAVLEERLGHVRRLAERVGRDDSRLGEALTLATRYPGPDCIHVIAGQPVLVFWAHAERGAAAMIAKTAPVRAPAAAATPAPPSPAPSAAPAPATAAICAGAGTTAGAATATVAARPVLGWRAGVATGLALLVVLLLIAGAAWWWRWGFFATWRADGGLRASLEREEARGSALEAEIAALERRLDDARKVCRAPDPAKTVPPLPDPPRTEPRKAEAPAVIAPLAPAAPPAEAPPATAPPIAEVPVPRPKPSPPPMPAAPAVPVEAPAQQPLPRPAKGCPAPRQPWEAPEVVFALDASGSMGFPYGLSDEEEAAIIAGVRRGDPSAVARARQIVNTRRGDRRIDHARNAMSTALDRLPGDVDAGLVVFGDCKGTDNFSFFKPAERGRLRGIVQSVEPRQGTPLARGIERAANMLTADDPKRPAVIVVLSDGHDSCGADPCATARALKARKPGLVINVVQVTNGDSASCLARETGGRVFNATDAGGVLPAVQKATGQAPVPAECQKP